MKILVRLFCLCSLLSLAELAVARELPVCMVSGDLPPLSFVDHEGQGQWLVREALRRAGHTVRFEAVPWPRCLEGLEHERYAAALGAGANPKFFSFMSFPRRNGEIDSRKSLGSITQVVVRRVGSTLSWDGQRFAGQVATVMYRRGYASVEKKLAELHVAGDADSNGEEQTLEKLLLGRGDIAIALLEPAQALLAQDKYRGRLEILPIPFLELPLYLGFNHHEYAADPRLVEAVWEQIKVLRASPEWQTLAPSLAQ